LTLICVRIGNSLLVSHFIPSEKQTKSDEETAISILCRAGAKLSEKDKYGFSPLHYAALRGNETETKQLLACPGIDIEVIFAFGLRQNCLQNIF
jgi:ankyrin repeat protein